MFIECYSVPIQDWDKSQKEIAKPNNKILIPLNRIEYICSVPNREHIAEIHLSSDKRLNVLGSYECILSKIENLGATTHIMHRLK